MQQLQQDVNDLAKENQSLIGRLRSSVALVRSMLRRNLSSPCRPQLPCWIRSNDCGGEFRTWRNRGLGRRLVQRCSVVTHTRRGLSVGKGPS